MSTAPVEVNIQPKLKFLSPEELIRLRNEEIKESKIGLKRATNTNTVEEASQLQKSYAELRQRISVPRIERLQGRALATWNTEEQAMQVLRKDGKFENFGYNRNGQLYLEFFEALFLLEVGRLQLEYNAMIMSVEQAYLLLLGEQASPKFNEYLVYSHFMRSGFILNRHKASNRHTEVSYEDCVWSLCQHAVQNIPIPVHIKDSFHFNIAQTKMNEVKVAIVEQQQLQVLENAESTIALDFSKKFNTLRNTTSSCSENTKRLNLHPKTGPHGSFIDFLRDRPDYSSFEAIFDNLNIIKLDKNITRLENCRQLQISFDLYLHHEGFKKSTPTEPELCMIILQAEESFPAHTEISQCFLAQQGVPVPVPLLVLAVSESKQIQGFLYYFT